MTPDCSRRCTKLAGICSKLSKNCPHACSSNCVQILGGFVQILGEIVQILGETVQKYDQNGRENEISNGRKRSLQSSLHDIDHAILQHFLRRFFFAHLEYLRKDLSLPGNVRSPTNRFGQAYFARFEVFCATFWKLCESYFAGVEAFCASFERH